MLRLLFFIFVVVSVIEIALFVWLAKVFSAWFVVIGIFLMGILGVFLAKYIGVGILVRARNELSQGRVPTDEIFDGIAVLISAVLLITPGFFTDLVGLLLLLPFVRIPLKVWAQQFISEKLRSGSVYFYRRF